jgi:hypothetical protein
LRHIADETLHQLATYADPPQQEGTSAEVLKQMRARVEKLGYIFEVGCQWLPVAAMLLAACALARLLRAEQAWPPPALKHPAAAQPATFARSDLLAPVLSACCLRGAALGSCTRAASTTTTSQASHAAAMLVMQKSDSSTQLVGWSSKQFLNDIKWRILWCLSLSAVPAMVGGILFSHVKDEPNRHSGFR